MTSSVYSNPAFVGLVVGLPTTLGSYWAYKRSRRADMIAEQAGIATVASGTIGQVIDGLNKIVTNLQNDNVTLRASISTLGTQYDDCLKRLSDLNDRMPRPPPPDPKETT